MHPATLLLRRLAPAAPGSAVCLLCSGTRLAADPFGGPGLVPCPACAAPDDDALRRHLDAARDAVLLALDSIPEADTNRRARIGLVLETLADLTPPPRCDVEGCGREILPGKNACAAGHPFFPF